MGFVDFCDGDRRSARGGGLGGRLVELGVELRVRLRGPVLAEADADERSTRSPKSFFVRRGIPLALQYRL
jgi:hypothetical protein